MRIVTVEVLTVLIAFLLVILWVATNYFIAVYNFSFDKNFLAQLANMAMLALGVLGISKGVNKANEVFNGDPHPCPKKRKRCEDCDCKEKD